MNLSQIFKRVAHWNSMRYDQEYNHDLAVNLLFEELIEFYDSAESEVGQLDALCDIIYVAMGVVWKCDPPDFNIEVDAGINVSSALLTIGVFAPIFHVSSVFAAYQHDSETPICPAMWAIVSLCIAQMRAMGLNEEQCIAALSIVCDSNDTKKIEKVSADIKANKDKGEYFVSPEPRLAKLLEARSYGEVH